MVNMGSFLLVGMGGMIMTVGFMSGVSVPLLNAAMMATDLGTNMLMQIALGLTWYNKSMRIGTLLFAAGVVLIADVGPPGIKHEVGTTLDVFVTIQSTSWILTVAGVAIASAIGILLTRTSHEASVLKMLCWAGLVSSLACLADNTASLLGILAGVQLHLASAFYFFLGLVMIALTAKAPAVCDASLYVPVQLCWQLINNMMTGFFVWHHQDDVHNLPAYLVAFCICVTSVYLSCPGENTAVANSLHGLVWRRSWKRHVDVRERLVESWHRIRTAAPNIDEAAEESARQAMRDGLRVLMRYDQGELICDLCLSLVEDKGTFALNSTVFQWIQAAPGFTKLMARDQDFRKEMLKALPDAEFERLRASSSPEAFKHLVSERTLAEWNHYDIESGSNSEVASEF